MSFFQPDQMPHINLPRCISPLLYNDPHSYTMAMVEKALENICFFFQEKCEGFMTVLYPKGVCSKGRTFQVHWFCACKCFLVKKKPSLTENQCSHVLPICQNHICVNQALCLVHYVRAHTCWVWLVWYFETEKCTMSDPNEIQYWHRSFNGFPVGAQTLFQRSENILREHFTRLSMWSPSFRYKIPRFTDLK